MMVNKSGIPGITEHPSLSSSTETGLLRPAHFLHDWPLMFSFPGDIIAQCMPLSRGGKGFEILVKRQSLM